MGGHSDEDKSCTGPGSKDVTKGSTRKRSAEKTSNEKIEDTQAGGETTKGGGTEGRDATRGADTTQVTGATEEKSEKTGPLIIEASSNPEDVKRMDTLIGGGETTRGEDFTGTVIQGRKMDALDLKALNNMERSNNGDEEDSFESKWAFWRRRRRKRLAGKRKRTKTKNRRRSKERRRDTERTRHNSVTSKPSKKEEKLNPFNPGAPLPDFISTIDTVADTTKDGPGLNTIIMKNDRKHLDNEKKYMQLILEQRDDIARMRGEINKKEEQLADAEAHRKRGLWHSLTGTYLAKTITSAFVMVLFYGTFVSVIGSIFSYVPFDEKLYL